MNSRKKISGFTILEAMVSLLISTLLVAFAFGVYLNFSKSYNQFENSQKRLSELVQIKRILKSDWDKTLHPRGNEEMIILQDEFKQNVITYQFLDSLVIREAESKDTFQIKVKNLEYAYFAGAEKEELLTSLQLTIEKSNQDYVFTFYKEHDLKTKLKYHVD